MPFLRLLPTLLVLALVAMRFPVSAQDESPLAKALQFIGGADGVPPTKPGFTTIKEVNRIFTTPGSPERVVKFSGIVVQSVPSHSYVFVQQGSDGIQLVIAKDMPVPGLGDEVEVETKVKFVVANGDTTVSPTVVRVTGSPGVQSFQKPKLVEIRAGKYNRQAVEVEAVVLDAFFKPTGADAAWWLLLSDDDGTCLGGIYSYPEGWSAADLVGKRVRFRGVGMPGGEFILRCTSPEEVTVLGSAESGSALKPFTSVREMRDYGAEKTRLRQYPVIMRAICTYVHPTKARFFIHDGKEGAEVKCRTSLCPEPGDEVEVQGIVSAGSTAVYLTGWNVEVLAKGKEAAAEKWKMGMFDHNEGWGDWLEFEAVVIHAQIHRQTKAAIFYLAENDTWLRVYVNAPPPVPSGGWWNARVRVRGVMVHDGRLIAWSNGGKDFSTITPGVAHPFDVPERTSAALRGSAPSASRVRVKGTVLAFEDGWIFLRDATGAIRSDTATHFEPNETYTVLPNHIRWPVAGLKPGDEVELVGSPMAPAGGLRYSNVRVIRSGDPPRPKAARIADVAHGGVANDLVTLRGRLVGYASGFISDMYATKRWRETLRLDDAGEELEVILEDGGPQTSLSNLAINDLIEATGIARSESGKPAFRLRIGNVDSVRSLGPDPSIARAKIVRIGITATILLAAALAWVWLTRRTVAQRTAQLAVANRQLDAALAEERNLGELKNRFVSLVSHEFRTPLGVTMSAVELMRHYEDRLPADKRAELCNDIHEATLRMSGMMEQMLVLGRVESGRMQCKAMPLDLPEFAEKLVDESLSATAKKCPIELMMDGNLAGASGDEALLRHIVSNLLSNAAKYSEPGSPVTLRVSRDGADAVLVVSDRGIGIPEGDRERLFEAFHRASNVGETPGTGLGLMIVKRCVELHGGTICFESEMGKGTVFNVRIPLFAE